MHIAALLQYQMSIFSLFIWSEKGKSVFLFWAWQQFFFFETGFVKFNHRKYLNMRDEIKAWTIYMNGVKKDKLLSCMFFAQSFYPKKGI